MIQACKDYLALSSAHRAFLGAQCAEGEQTPQEWLDALQPVVSFEPGSFGGSLVLPIFGSIGGLMLAGLLNALGHGRIAATLALGLVALWGVLLFLRRRRLGSTHLSEAVVPLLLILREDVPAGGKVALRLDLRGAEAKAKRTEVKDVPVPRGYRTAKEATFHDRWMEGSAELADGTRVLWTVDDYVRRRTRTKRNARGRVKSKHKLRALSHVKVRVGLRLDRYVIAPAGRAGIVADDRRAWVKVQRVVEHARSGRCSPEDFIRPIMEAYHLAQPRETRT